MDLIDSHCHLTATPLRDQLDDVLDRATQAGVRRVITVATDIADARLALDAVRNRPGVYLAVGIHPHEADQADEQAFTELRTVLADPNTVAAGEMGLDYHYDFSDRDAQRNVFARQLALASDASLPVVIHCRQALDDTIAILKNAGLQGRNVVFHCFSDGPAQAARIADHGWRLSFTGLVTFKNATDPRQVARDYPEEQIMIETDAPYLSPVPVRKVRPCEPAFVAHTLAFLAELRGQAPEDLARACTRNTERFFNLPPQSPEVRTES